MVATPKSFQNIPELAQMFTWWVEIYFCKKLMEIAMVYLCYYFVQGFIKQIDAGATEAILNATVKSWLNNKVPRKSNKHAENY